jgi:hypothetical protein
MAANIGGGRALRVCDLCGGVDDHPRHVLAGGDQDAFPKPTPEIVRRVVESAPEKDADRLLADLLDTGTSDRHMDCCREVGCPDGSCRAVTAGAEDLRGADLLNHLTREG